MIAYRSRRPIVGIMVGVLMVAGFDRRGKFRHRLFGRALIRDVAQIAKPRHAAFAAKLNARREIGGIVERPCGDVQFFARRIIIQQWRTAFRAKSACDGVRTFEKRRRAACPLECIAGDADQRSEEIAHGLLTHAAMANVGAIQHGIGAVAHCAALAPTGQDCWYASGFVGDGHGCVSLIPTQWFPVALMYNHKPRG
jgi:hypothetical protein